MQRCTSPDITEGPKLPPAEQRRPGRPKKSVPVSVDTAVSTKWILKTEKSYLLGFGRNRISFNNIFAMLRLGTIKHTIAK